MALTMTIKGPKGVFSVIYVIERIKRVIGGGYRELRNATFRLMNRIAA
jgi:hypothetical protein